MDSHFKAEFFKENREKLRTLFKGTAPIVISAAAQLQRNGDAPFDFRQDSNFWYLTGLDIPEALLVMDKGKEYIIVPDQSPNDEVFGSKPDFENLTKISGITDVTEAKNGWKQLSARLKRVKHIATIAPPPVYSNHYGFYTNPASRRLIARCREINPEATLLDLRKHLMKLRVVKQPQELSAIKNAIKVTEDTLKSIRRKLPSYEYEYEIEADLLAGFRKRGATGQGFSPIVGSGSRSAVLHYQANNAALKGAGQVVLDVGAEVDNYSADITRTYALNRPSKRLRLVHEAVLDVQEFARAHLKPGVIYRDYEKLVHEYMGEHLRELGLIKSISPQSVRKYYPHSTSHFLGLDVHDVGDYGSPLAEGMVMTVEPGIYIAEENIGIRIEDDVLITKDGAKYLTKLPKKL